ncbi:hypothetical protein AGMMS50284_4740 [Clostridia bacterium]|nr:hypothetical protein AGMMS50284_4740 [Clostridia bacterium]
MVGIMQKENLQYEIDYFGSISSRPYPYLYWLAHDNEYQKLYEVSITKSQKYFWNALCN